MWFNFSLDEMNQLCLTYISQKNRDTKGTAVDYFDEKKQNITTKLALLMQESILNSNGICILLPRRPTLKNMLENLCQLNLQDIQNYLKVFNKNLYLNTIDPSLM